MKRRFILGIVSFLMLVGLTACGTEKEKGQVSETGSKDKVEIVAVSFPEYDWIRQIVGEDTEHVDLTFLLEKGVDLHSFQPSAEDMMKLADADLVVYVGGESQSWVGDALKNKKNENQRVINLLEALGDEAEEEEIIEGMEVEDDHDHDHDHDEDDHDEDDHDGDDHDHDEDELELDEHVWLSPKKAEILVTTIAKTLEEVDADHEALYEDHAKAYLQEIKELDQDYQKAIDSAAGKTLLFGDRFPFRYLVEDYGLSYYAAFVGCSAETEASFGTVTYLSGKVDELGLKTVLTIDHSDQKVAKTIVENTKEKNQEIATLNSMQSISVKDIQDGATYLTIMQENLKVLEQALN